MRLGKKRREAMGDTKAFRGVSGVVAAARAPAVKVCAVLVKVSDVGDDARNGNDCAAGSPNQSVIDIDINGESHRQT